jgi:hypothetical protein
LRFGIFRDENELDMMGLFEKVIRFDKTGDEVKITNYMNSNMVNELKALLSSKIRIDETQTKLGFEQNAKEIIRMYFELKGQSESYNLISHLYEVPLEPELYNAYILQFAEFPNKGEYRGYRC